MNDKYITLIHSASNETWQLTHLIKPLSQLLLNMQEQLDPHDDSNLFNVYLPQFLSVDTIMIEHIKMFYSSHNYRREGIRVDKIRMHSWQKSIDPISFKYVNQYLMKESEQKIRQILQVVQYLKFNDLKQVICNFIASKHYYNYREHEMEETIRKSGIYYSRQQQINLKKAFLDYNKQFSKDILDKYRANLKLKSKVGQKNE